MTFAPSATLLQTPGDACSFHLGRFLLWNKLHHLKSVQLFKEEIAIVSAKYVLDATEDAWTNCTCLNSNDNSCLYII